MEQAMNFNEIRKCYPDEWVLLGNPIMDNSLLKVFSGIPLYHSKDKKELCYSGRSLTGGYDKITVIYTGTFAPKRTSGFSRRISQ
jgi:hypothetical protein